jgi:hypothetical protein
VTGRLSSGTCTLRLVAGTLHFGPYLLVTSSEAGNLWTSPSPEYDSNGFECKKLDPKSEPIENEFGGGKTCESQLCAGGCGCACNSAVDTCRTIFQVRLLSSPPKTYNTYFMMSMTIVFPCLAVKSTPFLRCVVDDRENLVESFFNPARSQLQFSPCPPYLPGLLRETRQTWLQCITPDIVSGQG